MGGFVPACHTQTFVKVAKLGIEMKKRIDGSYKPINYFWAYDRGIRLASNIKGAERKALFERLLKEGDSGACDELLNQSSLTDEQRRMANVHPAFMGGEYLPDCDSNEVEIARITIASTTQDVTCVYAKRVTGGIDYRVVDEYEGMTLDDETIHHKNEPMALSELVQFFMTAWDLRMVLDANFVEHGYPRSHARGFIVDASSSFYAQFGDAMDNFVEDWVSSKSK
ncbi:hypothetical protein [Limnohabitans sp. Rim8]|uniref:hypothetical protein n=1 Tax=Limnohabitans sp. Rim8 TaxID=1100718 RepID=UPI003305666A